MNLITIIFSVLLIFNTADSDKITCPKEDSVSKKMVENFLSNSDLSSARQETGTSNLDVSQIQVVSDNTVCQTLDNDFLSYKSDYKITYYKVGDFYFVTQILEQPDDTDEVVTGLSFIYIYDKDLKYIEGYSG